LKLLTAAQVTKIQMPPWVLDGWIRAKTLTMLSAPGFAGKSNLATALAAHAASGRGFLGQPAPVRRMRVVYVGNDAADWDHATQLRRILAGAGLPPESCDPTDEHSGGLWYCFQSLTLSDPSRFDEILGSVAYPSGALPDLIVVDTLRAFHDLDENDSTAMTHVMRFFRGFAARNAAILLLHHSKKPPRGEGAGSWEWDSARGSSAIHNSLDTHMILVPFSGRGRRPKLGAKSSKISVRWVKGRGGAAAPALRYKMEWSDEAIRFTEIRPPGRPMVSGVERVL